MFVCSQPAYTVAIASLRLCIAMPGTFDDCYGYDSDDEDMWMYAPFPQIEWLWERREEHWALAEEYLRACFRMWRRETQRALMRRGAWVVRRGMRPAGVEAWGLGYQGPAP